MRLFTGRTAELKDLQAALRKRFSVLVEGDPGSGKTTLLRAVIHAARGQADGAGQLRIFYVRAEGIEDPVQVLVRVLNVIDDADEVEEPNPSRSGTAIDALASLTRRQSEGPIAILLDDVGAPLGRALFAALRDELWDTETTWVVATTTEQAAAIRRPPADAFFEVSLLLEPLSAQAAVDLLVRRLPDATLDQLRTVAAAGGQPREVLDVARQIDFDSGEPLQALQMARREWEARLAELGRSAAMLVAELRDLGPVSASDDRLLRRMGWTRSRAIQVLRALEEAGLATSSSPPQAGPGRPKKLYRLLTLDELTQRRRRDSVPEK